MENGAAGECASPRAGTLPDAEGAGLVELGDSRSFAPGLAGARPVGEIWQQERSLVWRCNCALLRCSSPIGQTGGQSLSGEGDLQAALASSGCASNTATTTSAAKLFQTRMVYRY